PGVGGVRGVRGALENAPEQGRWLPGLAGRPIRRQVQQPIDPVRGRLDEDAPGQSAQKCIATRQPVAKALSASRRLRNSSSRPARPVITASRMYALVALRNAIFARAGSTRVSFTSPSVKASCN